MEEVMKFADDLGPLKIIHVYQPSVGLNATLVVDNVARGPSIGGMRMAPDVTTEECFRLARAMTLKNAAADLPHGGGKMVINADPNAPREQKEQILRCLVNALRNETDYVFAPDMGTNETCMSWIRDEVDRVVGLPRSLGGIPLDEIGATAWGLKVATKIATDATRLNLNNARFAVQGFGAVGSHVARFLSDEGATLVAASESTGAIANPDGLDVSALIELKQNNQPLTSYGKAQRISPDELIGVDCDIWIPAARPDVINAGNAASIKASIIAQGANIPATAEAEQLLHERGVLVLPDFIANAGGVICAAMEFAGATESMVFPAIEEKIARNMATVIEHSHRENLLPRAAAERLARSRVETAMQNRRWTIF